MITNIINLLELSLLFIFVAFFIRVIAVLMVVIFTGIHPERKQWYMNIFHVTKKDL